MSDKLRDTADVPSALLDQMLRDVLLRPSPEGARIIALRWLTRLEKAREQWQDAIEPPPQRESTAEYSVRVTSGNEATQALHKVRTSLRPLAGLPCESIMRCLRKGQVSRTSSI